MIDSKGSPSLTSQRNEFFLPPDLSYLNCAFMSPMSRRVENAGLSGLRSRRNPHEIHSTDFFDSSDSVRRGFAQLTGATTAIQISIGPSVSYAVATAAKNIQAVRGDEILLLGEQFPSHVYTWRRLTEEVGARLVVVPRPNENSEQGRKWNERILNAINPQTVAVCLPVIHWTDGTLFDIELIAERARDVGAFIIIDGTQSVGALPFDIGRVKPDVLICAGYKWLMGPYGIALTFWSERFQDGIPIEENWITRRGSENFAALVEYADDYQAGAIRFDVGERSNFVSIPMMREALTLIEEWQPARIQNYCRMITEHAVKEIRNLGYLIEDDKRRAHHLFGIRAPEGRSLAGLPEMLFARKISVSVRGSSIRVAPNVYNNVKDLDRLVDTLRTYSLKKAR